jgi:hypothetical protein
MRLQQAMMLAPLSDEEISVLKLRPQLGKREEFMPVEITGAWLKVNLVRDQRTVGIELLE